MTKHTLSLGQLLELHRLEGRGSFSIKPHGHVDIVVRNADGSVDQAMSKSNLTTSLWNDNWHFSYGSTYEDLTSMYVIILPEDGDDMNPYKTMGRHLYPNNYEVFTTASVNTSTKTYTYTVAFGQPSSDRTVRYVGLRTSIAAQRTSGAARFADGIFAMTKLTSDITQTSSQTLEVVYRVSFTRS